VPRINLRRAQLTPFSAIRPPSEIAMEACGGTHHWARELIALGHEVRLIPPQYVKPYVKRSKNDRNDAEAICEAAGRPGMHFVSVNAVTRPAQGMVLKVRDSLVGWRTQLVNKLRGHAAEFDVLVRRTAVLARDPTYRLFEHRRPLRFTWSSRIGPTCFSLSPRQPHGHLE
jgi:transposase